MKRPWIAVTCALLAGVAAAGVGGGPVAAAGITVGGVSPRSLPQGAAYQDVVLTGSGFADGDTVSFGSGVLVNSVSVEGPTQITASVSVAAAAVLTSRNVVVTQGTVHGSCIGCFTVSDTPSVAGVTPTLPQGAVHQSVQVQGSNFMPGASVSFSVGSGVTVESVSYQSPSQLAVTISVASSAPVHTDNVTVTNKTTGSPSGSCTGCFAVSDTPVVTSLVPQTLGPPGPTPTLPQGAAQQGFNVQGSNFMPNPTVSFGAGSGITVSSVLYQGPFQLSIIISVASSAPLQSDNVTVTNKATGSPHGTCTGCLIVSDTPAVSSLFAQTGGFGGPPTLPQGAAQQVFVVQGSNFTTKATVSFGAGSGVTVNNVSYQSLNQLTITISVAASAPLQTDNVTVTNHTTGSPSGTCTGCFIVSDTPVVSFVSVTGQGGFPGLTATLPQGALQQTLSIQGSNFMARTAVSFGAGSGVTVNSVSYQSPYQLTITISVAASAPLQTDNVTVTNQTTGAPNGTCTGCFSVSDTPAVSFVSTPTGPFFGAATLPQGAANQTFTVFGSNFMPNATVSFGAASGVTVSSVSYQSPFQLTITISVASTAPLQSDNVTVTNKTTGLPSGTCNGCFVVSDTPTVSNVSPGAVSPGAIDTEQSVFGQNFQGNATVSLNPSTGITINSVRFENPGELIVNMTVAPSVPNERVDITVTNPAAPSPNFGTCLGCLSVT
jgi:hypothetical protein